MNTQTSPIPQVAILGGINGAGKTTASQRILRDARSADNVAPDDGADG